MTKTNIAMVVLLLFFLSIPIFIWNKYQNATVELKNLKTQLSLQEDIEKTESRLKEIKEREDQYVVLISKQNNLIQSIKDLDKKQKELDKRKKETILNEIKNFNQDDIKSALTTYGISSSVMER